MKSRRFSKNLEKRGLLLNLSLLLFCFIFGCTSSTEPTYLKEDIAGAIRDLCQNEYKTEVKTKLMGQTLWVYIPLEDVFVKADKPEKFIEKFSIEQNKGDFQDETFRLDYLIKAIPEQEKYQEIKYAESAAEKVNNVYKILFRVLFSMEELKKGGPQFFCVVTADIKNGIEMKEIFYCLDLKKLSYNFISRSEFQHRTIADTQILPEIIGDKEGLRLNYHDITWEEFIIGQIEQRIKLKFQKAEVNKSADIDKEILKVVIYTLKTYNFKDFSSVALTNLLTNNRTVWNKAAIWAGPTE